MTGSYTLRPLVLGLFPTTRGFGWVVFEGPFAVVDYGLFTAFKDKNPACLERIDALLGKFLPETVVVEAFDPALTRRHPRIQRLGLSITALVNDRGHNLTVFERWQVRVAFSGVGAVGRQEIAEAVARSVPMLSHRLPKRRKSYESEPRDMAIFNAAALVLTHYHFGCRDVLDELRDAA